MVDKNTFDSALGVAVMPAALSSFSSVPLLKGMKTVVLNATAVSSSEFCVFLR